MLNRAYFALLFSAAACAWAADARRGALVLEDQNCLACHTVGGQAAGHEAPPNAIDLAKPLTSTYTPAALASMLWNHTPAMWSEMSRQDVALPRATEADWEDLFAYLYSQRALALPADSRHGKDVFEKRQCATCHGAVLNWNIEDPAALAYNMWSHALKMARETNTRKVEWPELSGRDLTDITAYVRVQKNQIPVSGFSLPEPESGRESFNRNCAKCHQGTHALELRLRNKAWMDVAAEMWNHASRMSGVAVAGEDMKKILAYVWELQYQGPTGNPERGHKVFNEKRCIVCHSPATGPRPGKAVTVFSMVALGWGPGRQMHAEMQKRDVPWPYLSPADVSNLVAYFSTLLQ